MQIVVFLLLSVSAMAYADVVATDMTFSRKVPDSIYPFSGQSETVLIDATIDMHPNSDGISGACLWKVNIFGSRSTDGSGEREPLSTQILNSSQAATPVSPGGRLHFRNVLADFDILKVGCGDIKYFCLEFTRCDSPRPYFYLETSDRGKAIVKCQEEICRVVVIDDFTTNPLEIDLVEGRSINPVSFEAVASSNKNGGTVRDGSNLWIVSFWGSEKFNGSGPVRGLQQQVLGPYFSSIPLSKSGDKIVMSGVVTHFDMIGLKCADVPYLCAEFTKDPMANPPFEMKAPPEESALTHCFPVPDGACRSMSM